LQDMVKVKRKFNITIPKKLIKSLPVDSCRLLERSGLKT